MSRLPILLLSLLTICLATAPAGAQDAFAAEEQALVKKAVSTLSSFANQAKSRKVGQRAKQAYDLILDYDPEHSATRRALDFEKKSGEWVLEPPEKRTRWVDQATYQNRFKTADAWYKTCMKLSELHKKLGLNMQAAGDGRATFHLEKAVYYNAMDEEANVALGYKKGPGFYGTDEQIAFAHKLKQIETKAIEIARQDYPVEALPQEQMPKELVALTAAIPDWMATPSFDIHGAKSEHFTVWTRGSQENADNAVKWGERALDFGIYLMGEKRAKQLGFVERASQAFAWRGFLWTAREREEFLKANPHVWANEGSMERAKDFANNIWRSDQGTAVMLTKLTPVSVHDAMIGYVFQYGLTYRRNVGMGQGIIHAATWYLQYTSISRWGARPKGTVSSDDVDLPDMASWWLRAVRDQATSRTDWEAAQVPREQLDRFRNECRLKTWSFTTWLLAACPEKWLDYFLALPVDRIPTLEDIYKIAQEQLGRDINELDAQWREWARGDSGVAFGTGYGPPLLPERPSKEELAVLDRLNAARATNLTYSWGADGKLTEGALSGLPECELDAESSMACEDHARFLTMHPKEHLRWPEAHEENPALEGFSPRGQRAAMGSVIVHMNAMGGVDFARDSIDGWLGTPYHRFPLLEHNIKRFGYSFLYENDYTVAVLDMGSLREPYNPVTAPKFIMWPPPGMEKVPTSFHGIEHPNPLADQPEDQQDITRTGYPISLQLQSQVALQLADSDMELWEARKGGRPPEKHFVHKGMPEYKAWVDRCKDKVEIWLHTPKIPLNKRMEIRDVVFCIPKERLEANKQYQARVKLQIGGADPLWMIWEFTTGSQKEGLKL